MKVCLNRATAGSGLQLPEFVELAALAGFDGADVDMAWGMVQGSDALAALYAKYKLAMGAWGIPFDWRGDISGSAEGVALLAKHAKVAAAVACDSCCTWIMPSSEFPLHHNWHFHLQRLMPIAKALADHGLRLGLEFVSPYHLRRMREHEFVYTPMAMLDLAAELGDNCGLLVDSFHLHAAGEPMSVLSHIPANRLVYAHINDAPPGPLDQVHDRRRLAPGKGIIDLKGFVQGLKEAGYRGPVSVEILAETPRPESALELARHALQATKKTLEKA
jgi:sugar phosphate isomerase/epimerase